ncbi:MAG: ATP-binding protein [Terracidiphilus sp.]
MTHLLETAPSNPGSECARQARVLLISGDARADESLEQALIELRCSFDRVTCNEDALRLLRSTPYPVVITDRGTGIEEDLGLVEEIREIQPGARIILLTPSGTTEEIIEALRQRVFLCKCAPFNAEEIANYVVSAIETADLPVGIEVLSARPDWISIRMNSHMLNADRLIAFFNQLRTTMTEQPREELMIAFREILNNAIEHGAQNDPSKFLQVAAVRTARTFVFHISDPGEGFRRDAIPHSALSNMPDQPTRHLEIREETGMRPGGYGLLLASGIVDELIYNEKGNEALLIKYIPDSRISS